MATEIGSAYFTLIPSMAGTAAAVRTGLGAPAVAGAFTKGGQAGGAALGAGLVAGSAKFLPIIGGAFAALGIANVFDDAINAASDLNESANAVKVTFGEANDEITKLSETASNRLGLSQVDFNAAAVRFSSFADGLATDGKSVSDIIDEITTRGADFASVYNIDVADALSIFQSGLSGEAEPLKRFGINLLDSSVNAYAYANGIAESGKQLTQAQKLQARYGLLLQETSKVQGDFANTSDQLANQQRINAANLENALAKVGTALLPVVTEFARFIGSKENQERLGKLVDLFIKLEPAIEFVGDVLINLAELNFENLDQIITFFDAVADGNLTLEDTLDIFHSMPKASQDAIRSILSLMSGVTNSIIDAVNTARQALNGLLGTKLPLSPHVNFGKLYAVRNKATVGGIPMLAGGGSLVGSGSVLVGERGPELLNLPAGASVVPLDGSAAHSMDPSIMRLLRDVATRPVQVDVDGEVVARSATNGNSKLAALGAS